MKKYTSFSILLLVFAYLLLLIYIPITFVSAQRFQGTPPSSENLDDTGEAEEVTHFFDDLITDERVRNSEFTYGFIPYKHTANQVTLTDQLYPEEQGSPSSTVVMMNFLQEPYVFDINDSEFYLLYDYGNDELFSEFAEVLYYFFDDELHFMSMFNYFGDLNQSDFAPESMVDGWLEEEASIDDIVADDFVILGIAEMQYSYNVFYMMAVPTLNDQGEYLIQNVIFYDDYVYQVMMMDYDYFDEQAHDSMYVSFMDFFALGEE